MKIEFVDLKRQYLNHKIEIDSAIQEVIEETAFISGKYAKLFEQEFALKYGVNHCISTANGTDSLYIIMKSLGVGPGDEVITVSNSWISSSETISQTGATPIFVDIEPTFHSIDINQLKTKITSKTKALLMVHLHGQMCQIDEIKTMAEREQLFLIEDCAQAHFSSLKGINAGLFGIAGSFSFYPGKNLGAYGDAGCIITNNKELADKCRKYANHGSLIKHKHEFEGINSRMDGIQANILRVKLKYIKEWSEARINASKKYNYLLKKLEEQGKVKTPLVRENSIHTFHVYQLECLDRDSLKEFLMDSEIPTTIHYPTPLPFLKCYKHLNLDYDDFKIVKSKNDLILSIPIFPEILDEEIEFICSKIYQFYAVKFKP